MAARGQMTTAPARTGGGAWNTSVLEDPSFRRERPGGGQRLIIQRLRHATPEILQTFHTDFPVVSASSPARPGETLIDYAKGLGPTQLALEVGANFRADPLFVVIAVDTGSGEWRGTSAWARGQNSAFPSAKGESLCALVAVLISSAVAQITSAQR